MFRVPSLPVHVTVAVVVRVAVSSLQHASATSRRASRPGHRHVHTGFWRRMGSDALIITTCREIYGLPGSGSSCAAALLDIRSFIPTASLPFVRFLDLDFHAVCRLSVLCLTSLFLFVVHVLASYFACCVALYAISRTYRQYRSINAFICIICV